MPLFLFYLSYLCVRARERERGGGGAIKSELTKNLETFADISYFTARTLSVDRSFQ